MAYQYGPDQLRPISFSIEPAMLRRVTVVARERGYDSRSAFVRDVLKKELDGDNGRHQGDGGQQQNLTKPNI